NGAERAREPGNLRARDLDAVKQRLEARIPGGMGGHERTADRASLSAEIEPELRQHAPYAPRLCIVILPPRADPRRLGPLEAIEGSKQGARSRRRRRLRFWQKCRCVTRRPDRTE